MRDHKASIGFSRAGQFGSGQAIATTAPDLPPEPGAHATFAREHEYKRHGTVSLLAGGAHLPMT
jgi:hypothetical protein